MSNEPTKEMVDLWPEHIRYWLAQGHHKRDPKLSLACMGRMYEEIERLRAELAEARGLLARVNETRVDDIPAWLRLLREILNFLSPPYSPAERDARGTTGE